jgi:environmental stress-induced protein Ves
MVQVFSKKDFKIQPWKNGGGTTTELYRLSKNSNDFVFRISSAKVDKNGPFSLYENMDRILILLKGKGLRLITSNGKSEMEDELAMHSFSGETAIDCELIDGECLDFNVMTDRRFARAQVLIEKGTTFNWRAVDSKVFIYLTSSEELIALDQGETHQIISKDLINVIVIKLNFLF